MSEKTFTLQADNRRDFINVLDIGLTAQGVRITKGTYEVTIKRLSKKELNAAQAQAEAEATCARKGHVDTGTGECTRCGDVLY